jgi:hypothetical protein
MSMSRARSAGESAAPIAMRALISNGADWIDSFRGALNGAELAEADTSAWQVNLRDDSGSVVLSVSVSAGTLTVTQATTHTLFEIEVPHASLSALCGDYQIDLIQETAGGSRTHWAHGVATVRHEPAWSE